MIMVLQLTVADVMTQPVLTVTPDTPLQQAVQMISDHHVSGLPRQTTHVVVADHLHGLLQRGVGRDRQNRLGHHISHRQLQDHDQGSAPHILSVVSVFAFDCQRAHRGASRCRFPADPCPAVRLAGLGLVVAAAGRAQ